MNSSYFTYLHNLNNEIHELLDSYEFETFLRENTRKELSNPGFMEVKKKELLRHGCSIEHYYKYRNTNN